MTVQDRLQNLISMTEDKCTEWLHRNAAGQMEFVDPIDKVEVSAHYGATHMAAALFLNGHEQAGNQLLKSVLERWDNSKNLPGFHNDFNNFALCVIYDYVSEDQRELIRDAVLRTSDSNHDTVNWLPMRWTVNLMRFKWTQKQGYRTACDACKKKIAQATWSDGFIDDRLPVGLSFNLQYDVATVAVMQYLRVQGNQVDIAKELGALLEAEAPDGDINYLGRGTNQIFAWGLWIYLLASSGQEAALNRAIAYLEKYLPIALKNNNLMLNDIPGEEKYMWWDYHYCSVYTAHLLMWLNLARNHFKKEIVVPLKYAPGDSGVIIQRDESYFVALFRGRREYLAESGPMLSAFWTKKHGMLYKGNFGPYGGAFGQMYSNNDFTLYNSLALWKSGNQNIKGKIWTRIWAKMHWKIKEKKDSIDKVHIEVVKKRKSIDIICSCTTKAKRFLVLPFSKVDGISITIDGKKIQFNEVAKIRNQYGWTKLVMSRPENGIKWTISASLEE